MRIAEPARYALVECLVTGHQHYGLIVRLESGLQGFIDRADIADGPVEVDAWPGIGDRIQCVVLGTSRDGRVRLNSRPRDRRLVSSISDPISAQRGWDSVKSPAADRATIDIFFEAPYASALMQWALAHPLGSIERRRAEELLRVAPERMLSELYGDETK